MSKHLQPKFVNVFHRKMNFSDVIRIRDLKIRRLCWIIHVTQMRTLSQFSSVQSLSLVWLFETLWATVCQDCCMPGFPVRQLPEPTQTHVHRVRDAINHLILCHPLLLPPSIFPSIRVFSDESVLFIRWPMYWNFSFSISPSNEYWGLISFRIVR